MKRLSVLLIAAVLLVATMSAAFAATMYVDTANHKTLNLRSHDNDKVIAQIPYRAAVEVHSFFQSDTCAYVTYNGQFGWVYTRYLSWNRPAKSSATANIAKNTAKNTASTVKNTASTAGTNVFSGIKKVTAYDAVVQPGTPTGYVNLRWAPSKQAAIHGVRYLGNSVRVIAENKYWAQVIDNKSGECGYMLKKFLKKVEVSN